MSGGCYSLPPVTCIECRGEGRCVCKDLVVRPVSPLLSDFTELWVGRLGWGCGLRGGVTLIWPHNL